MKYSIDQDLEQIWPYINRDLIKLDSKSIFLTGCTGLFGVWILSTLLFAKKKGINVGKLFVLSRNPSKFIKNYPKLTSELGIQWICADVSSFDFPDVEIDYCIHGASTSATETFFGISNFEKFSTITKGSQRVLNLVQTQRIKSVLYLSSGAVFGGDLNTSPAELDELYIPRINHLDEAFTLGHAKRNSESLFFLARDKYRNTKINIARLVTFFGPHMPMDVHYAIGNFIHSASEGIPLQLKSSGEAIRSYMYMSDAIVWLFKSLVLDKNIDFPLHVGSEKAISIRDLAEMIASAGKSEIISRNDLSYEISPAPQIYVPSTTLTKSILKVEERIGLDRSIQNTLNWIAAQKFKDKFKRKNS